MIGENREINVIHDAIDEGNILFTICWIQTLIRFKPTNGVVTKDNITYNIEFDNNPEFLVYSNLYNSIDSMIQSIKNRLKMIFDFKTYDSIDELNIWSAQYGMTFSLPVIENPAILVYCFIESYMQYRKVSTEIHNKYPNAIILNPFVQTCNNTDPCDNIPIYYTIDQIEKLFPCINLVYIDLEGLNKEHRPNWKKLKKLIDACKEANIDIEYSHPLESEYRYLINKNIAIQIETEIANKIGNTEYPWFNENITQTYLIYPNEGYTARLRHSAITENSDCGKFDPPKDKYYLTLKSATIDKGLRVEEEQELNKEKYELLLKWADPKANTIKKRRFNIQVPGSDLIKLISIDHYTSGQMTAWNYDVLEVEFRNPPKENIRINTIGDELSGLDSSLKLFEGDNILNITGNKAFSNKSLAFNDFVNPLAKLTVKEGNPDDVQ